MEFGVISRQSTIRLFIHGPGPLIATRNGLTLLLSSAKIFTHSAMVNWCLEFRSKAWRASPTTTTTSGRCACVGKERFP